MEKRRPHYALERIQAEAGRRGLDCFTLAALRGIDAMGLSGDEALRVVLTLPRSAFYKSMTTVADHSVWQDVYHAAMPCGPAYLKFTLREDGAVVISFKAL